VVWLEKQKSAITIEQRNTWPVAIYVWRRAKAKDRQGILKMLLNGEDEMNVNSTDGLRANAIEATMEIDSAKQLFGDLTESVQICPDASEPDCGLWADPEVAWEERTRFVVRDRPGALYQSDNTEQGSAHLLCKYALFGRVERFACTFGWWRIVLWGEEAGPLITCRFVHKRCVFKKVSLESARFGWHFEELRSKM
jgi:hypothetical protein